MKLKIDEDFNFIRLTYSDLQKSVIENDFSEIDEAMSLARPQKYFFRVANNGAVLSSESNLKDALEQLFDFIDDDITDGFEIIVEIDKSNDPDFVIFDIEAFSKSLPIDLSEKIEKFSQFLCGSRYLATKGQRLEVPEIEAVFGVEANLPDLLSNNVFKPEHAFFFATKLNGALSHLFKILASQYCLACISSDFSEKNIRNVYTFDGYASVASTTENENDYLSSFHNVYEVYKIVFSDNNFNTRLGLLRNLVSVRSSNKITEIFDENLIKNLHSNYQIYLRENIKQYIEVKNKTIELTHNLINKASEKFDEKQKAHQKILIGLATYIFTIIIGKVLLKSDIELFSFETSLTTTFFVLFIYLYVFTSSRLLFKAKNQLLNQLDILKSRYSNILHSTEVDEIFNVNYIENCFNENDVLLSTVAYYILLFVVVISFWLGYIIVQYSGLT